MLYYYNYGEEMKKVVVVAIIFLALFISGCTGSMEIAVTPSPTPCPVPTVVHEGTPVPSQTPDNSTTSIPAPSSTPTSAPTQVPLTTISDNPKDTPAPTPAPEPSPTATPAPTPTPGPLAKAGDSVSVDYTGRYDNGEIFEASSISFTVGEGRYLPILENGVIGMVTGESKVVTILPADAYGEYDPAAVKPLNMSEFEALDIIPVVGMTLDNVYYWPIRVDSIDTINKIVYVDYNHPLAGKTVHFTITLRSINK